MVRPTDERSEAPRTATERGFSNASRSMTSSFGARDVDRSETGPVSYQICSCPGRSVSPRRGRMGGTLKIGFHLTPFWSPTDRGATRIIDEAIAVVAAASRMGFAWVSIGQHWISHPTVWPQPFPILARLAPETGAMRLKTSEIGRASCRERGSLAEVGGAREKQ